MKLGAQFAEKSLLNIEHLHGASKKPLTVNYSRSNYVNKESRQVFLCLDTTHKWKMLRLKFNRK